MKKEFLWYHLGDQGDCDHVGNDLDALVDVLREATNESGSRLSTAIRQICTSTQAMRLSLMRNTLGQREADLGGTILQVNGGIQSENYSGWNYISVYWGDKDSNLVEEISRDEFEQIKREIER